MLGVAAAAIAADGAVCRAGWTGSAAALTDAAPVGYAAPRSAGAAERGSPTRHARPPVRFRRHPRHRRGADRVPAGLLDRASDPRRRTDRVQRTRQQGVRGRDPARRDPRRVLGLSRAAVRRRHRAAQRPSAQRFVANILVAFLPAAVAGVFLHRFIKEVLFSPWVVAVSLVIGGFLILLIERIRPLPRVAGHRGDAAAHRARRRVLSDPGDDPGVSRAGATIMGAMMLGVSRPAATEFSFFLAIPTMFGASAYDLTRAGANCPSTTATVIAVGFRRCVFRRAGSRALAGRFRRQARFRRIRLVPHRPRDGRADRAVVRRSLRPPRLAWLPA